MFDKASYFKQDVKETNEICYKIQASGPLVQFFFKVISNKKE
jgi:hypothetical protein